MENVKTKSLKYYKAFKEVYLLINDLSDELYVRIPESFIKIIKDNMDENYKISVDELNNNGTMEETDAVMSLIYRDFICSDELNKKLIEYDNEQILKEFERYNDIFDDKNDNKVDEKNSENIDVIENKENLEKQEIMVIEEKNFFIRFINRLKGLLENILKHK